MINSKILTQTHFRLYRTRGTYVRLNACFTIKLKITIMIIITKGFIFQTRDSGNSWGQHLKNLKHLKTNFLQYIYTIMYTMCPPCIFFLLFPATLMKYPAVLFFFYIDQHFLFSPTRGKILSFLRLINRKQGTKIIS